MSELVNNRDNRATIRWKLLTGVSALALTVSSIGVARADDTDQPQLWIELGGQLSHLDVGEVQFAPRFILATPRPAPETMSPLSMEHPPRFDFGEEGKISFEPGGSNWVLSAAIRYGRSASHQHVHQQSPYPTQPPILPTPNQVIQWQKAFQFIDTQASHSETHTVLDFQAGKDVGLGMFGAHGSSVLGVGVRFAQFGSKSNVAFKSDPDAHPTFRTFPNGHRVLNGAVYDSNSANATAGRSFHGVGPSISWNASAPFAGNPQDGELVLDWGLNAALLFGRQRTKVHHQTTSLYHHGKYNITHPRYTHYRYTPPDQVRSRSVQVPDVGGSVGVSWRVEGFKMSLGYRADFFLGAVDGGVDTRKSENRDFYGPFASVSFGVGDSSN